MTQTSGHTEHISHLQHSVAVDDLEVKEVQAPPRANCILNQNPSTTPSDLDGYNKFVAYTISPPSIWMLRRLGIGVT